jgi:hypothetical protein
MFVKRVINSSKAVRFGVDGCSERIRKIINKPIPYENIVNILRDYKYLFEGRWLKLFYIYGYDIEVQEDYEELYNIVRFLKYNYQNVVKNLQLKIGYLTPVTLTPLQFHKWGVYETGFKAGLIKFLLKDVVKKEISITTKPSRVLLDCILCGGSGLMGDVILDNWNKLSTEDDIIKLMESNNIYNIKEGYGIDCQLPNDYINYNKELLVNKYNLYKKKGNL